MPVITRFAPSPTGFLHIGGARTALFNWLYARHHGGKFLLRIEDTDRERSTQEAVDAIFEGLQWLGLDWDDEPVYQSARTARHVEVAQQLLADGKAYHCYCTPEELKEMRERARAEGGSPGYNGMWRDRDAAVDPPSSPDIRPTVRFKSPEQGETIIADQVQGDVKFSNQQLDDMILLRSDGTPTYMLAVVVDDHDMGVTHIIRGDDHLTNAARQEQLYLAMNWTPPSFSHVPLIHGPDGAKLSKRHGALGAQAYRDMGYLPEAMRNYLLRLGWSHGDDEIISTGQAIEWFGLDSIGKGPARFDLTKLASLNSHYLNESDEDHLVDLISPLLEAGHGTAVSDEQRAALIRLMPALKPRAKLLTDLCEGAGFLFHQRPLPFTEKAAKILDNDARSLLGRLLPDIEAVNGWQIEGLEASVREFAETADLKLGKVAQPLRAALTGSTVSPGIFDVLGALGREESLARIRDCAAGVTPGG